MNSTHRIATAGGVILSLLLAVIIVFGLGLFYITTPYFSAKAGTWLTNKSGRNIALEGSIETHLWSRHPRFIFTGVKIGNAEWSKDPTMFEASRIEFSIKPLELLRARIVLPELIIDQPKLVLEKNAKGAANWNFDQNPQAAMLKKPVPEKRATIPVIQHLKITDGKLTYRDPAKDILTNVNISTVSGESEHKENLHVSGKGSYQKSAFLIDLTGASILQLRESNAPYPFTLKTTVGPTSISVNGTVQDPVKLESFDVTLKLQGDNTADLFPLTGIALPPSPPYQVQGHLTHGKDIWHFENFAGRLGESDLKGDVTWDPTQATPYFKGDFTSDNLDMADLSGFIGAKKKPDDDARVIPDTPLDISRLLAMNADVNFSGKKIKEPTLMNNFSMQVHLKDGVLHVDPVEFGIASGKIEADILIEGKKTPPEATLKVNFQRLSLTDFFRPLAKRFGKENVSAGLLGGKASLQGTGKSLRDILATSNGDMGVGIEGGELSHLLLELAGLDLFRAAGLILTDSDEPVPLHCVIAHFTVESGVMHTHDFLVDTDVTAIRAYGGIDLRDETMDLSLHTEPKESSLISARSPIHIKGTLKHPSVGVDKGALALRAGAAAALGLVAPPAAILAFIEPGLGKEGNCAAFIQKLEKDTGAKVPHSEAK